MELWFSEKHSRGVKLSVKIKSQLFSGQSDFQRIDIFDTEDLGRMLTLDGVIMLTERDEFIYHEMIVHPAFAVNPNIENVLLIGAGDGGAAREISKYGSVKNIDLVEIDGGVIEAAKKYLPFTACGFNDSRVNITVADGLKFVRKCAKKYDLIIVDSTDPSGPGEVLFTKEFYSSCQKLLTDGGAVINQHESPFYDSDAAAAAKAHAKLKSVFTFTKLYQAHIPTYPSGHWLFGYSSQNADPVKNLRAAEWNAFNIKTGYYDTELHKGAFMLPVYVKEKIYGDE